MAEIKKSLSVNGNSVNYYIRYGKQKNIILRVREGEIHISAPEYAPDWEIERMIYKNISKITQVQNNYEVRSKYDLYGSQPWIKIFNKEVPLFIVDENIHTKQNEEGIFMKNYYDSKIQLDKIYTFLAKQYKNWFINRSSQYALMMGVEFRNMSVKVMNTKWGVCYPTQQKIIYNTKLLHFEPEIIDYVIIHELAHLRYHNHSKDFWRFVEQFLPNYREISKVLNSAGL
ncbi:SprT family zinc-dependent metalloprotease [[Acholeplasma] multilocale]|uniref:YgjP family zinc-dependent metalloprotease n=1 Tax=[Acholeplasma] multilocale TaxID=264638 RepID=UPI00047DC957|nr:SprT family zinc-dependent metalloprotease [[Acholeplasma] multilocale]